MTQRSAGESELEITPTSSIRALEWRGVADLRLTTVATPVPGPDEVRVTVAFAGICGSDLSMIDGVWQDASPGRVLGHEGSGVVDAVGADVQDVKIGSHVAMKVTSACGICRDCRDGVPSLCQYRTRHGGCWSDAIVVPRHSVYDVPRDLDLATAALAEPLSCALEAWERVSSKLGDDVVIVGGGTIGLLLTRLASAGGARRVVLVTRDTSKSALATQFGATTTIQSRAVISDTASDVRSVLGGTPDVVFEAAGVAASTELALALTRRGGTLALVGCGHTSDVVRVRPHDLVERDLRIVSSFGENFAMARALRLLSMLDFAPIITDSFPLAEYKRAIERAKTGGIKVLFRPHS